MNNCKKCGSERIDNQKINQGDKEGYRVFCRGCGVATLIYSDHATAWKDWNYQNKIEYKKIPELRVMFEKYYYDTFNDKFIDRNVLARNPGGDYEDHNARVIWNGYLQCAQDNGLLPKDMDLLRERVK